MQLKKIQIVFLLFVLSNTLLNYALANEDKTNARTYQGFITNKKYNPLKLMVSKLNVNSLFLIDRNLEDNSFIPNENLDLTASIAEDYTYKINDSTLHIPKETKLTGYISKIEPSKTFNREGFFEVTFVNAICPDGHEVKLSEVLESKSTFKIYHPLHHVGKSVASLIGGSLAGSLISLQLGGIGTAVSTNGSSIAAGAATGGFIGILSGIIGKGKDSSIEPGSELTLAPIDETSLEKLNQITCKNHLTQPNITLDSKDINLEILSIRKKKDFLGDTSVMIDIIFTSNSNEHYRLNNFFLRDSQGKEYSPSIINARQDFLKAFPANQKVKTRLEFFVNYPKATHWLVLKNNKFSKDLGKWRVETN